MAIQCNNALMKELICTCASCCKVQWILCIQFNID